MTVRFCYVHAGTGKTGSSAIQYALATAADDLRKHGYLYPNIDDNFHRVFDFKPTAGNARVIDRQVHLGNIDRALDWIRPYAEDPSHLILSCEGFANDPEENLIKFSEGLRDFGYTTRCLVFFRPQHQLIVSSYLQGVKSDKIRSLLTLREYALRRYNTSRNPFNWLDRVQRLENAFRDVTVKWYPAVIRQGPNGVADATFQWLGMSPVVSVGAARIINPTPGLEALHVLQRINSEGHGGKEVADAILLRAHAEGLLGSKVLLDSATIKTVQSTMHDSNVALLERYCPELSPVDELKLPETSEEQHALDPEIVSRLDAIAAQIIDQSKNVSIRKKSPARRGLNTTRRTMVQ